MKNSAVAIIVIALAILHAGSCSVQVFEFGEDLPFNRVLTTVKGTIHIFEKTKIVKLDIPPCHSVTYVKVTVDNLVSTPKVDFDKSTNTVTIAYKLLELDYSKYTILAKGYGGICD